MTSQPPSIRPATEADAPAIRAVLRGAQLNPRDLDWRRFLVADDAGDIVATAQVRVHGAGSREVASVAVIPARRGEGIGREIAEAVIAREPTRPLFLYTESRTVPFWERFAFRPVEDVGIPRDLRATLRLVRTLMPIYNLVTRHDLRLVVMRRDEP